MNEFDKRAIGRVIRTLRKERDLSQEVLSGLAGIGRSHLAMIESGKKNVNFETMWKISYALGVDPHVLVKKIEADIEAHNDITD